MGTWHIKRDGFANEKAFGSSICMLTWELRIPRIVQISPGGNMWKSCEKMYFANETIIPTLTPSTVSVYKNQKMYDYCYFDQINRHMLDDRISLHI